MATSETSGQTKICKNKTLFGSQCLKIKQSSITLLAGDHKFEFQRESYGYGCDHTFVLLIRG